MGEYQNLVFQLGGCTRLIFTKPAQQYPGGTIASRVDDPDVPHPRTNPEPAALPCGVFKTQLVIQEGRASVVTALTEGRQSEGDERKIVETGPSAGVLQWKVEPRRRCKDEEKTPRRGEREGRPDHRTGVPVKDQEAAKLADRPRSGESVASPGMIL
ncbi:hypothetical protein NDU88_004112 [Pleurodeles waltl]|uniref:Uncharacterized protein n=1 Tax=Pleurodeles waltl TaxID=8319 RepID=A0AAV7WUW8_PLEWA|nr:hypothetical protein NDU88_004112 [Pleurodeles waltl]